MHKLTIAPSVGKTVETIEQGECFFYHERHYIRCQEQSGNNKGYYYVFCAENSSMSVFAGTCPVHECKSISIIITE